MNHKQKIKLAKEMRTRAEEMRKSGRKRSPVPIFQTEAWEKRKEARKVARLKKMRRNKI